MGKGKRFHTEGAGNIFLALWYPAQKGTRVAGIWNRVLQRLFLPAAVSAWYLQPEIYEWAIHQEVGVDNAVPYGMLLGIVSGLLFHELSHMNAGLEYRARVFEAGIGIMNFFPSAYVLMDDHSVKGWKKRVQINMAGVEANLLLSGIYIYMILIFPKMAVMFISAAFINLLMALLNLFYFHGLDGRHVLENIWENDEIYETFIRKILYRRNSKKSGKGLNIYAMGFAVAVLGLFEVSALALTVASMLMLIL